MKNYVLMTDSCCDLGADVADQLELRVLPLSLLIENQEYANHLDGRELPPKKFYDLMRSGAMGSTSAISVGAFHDAMEQELQAGNDVLCITFSAALSTTHQSAVIAADELRGQYPEAKILVVDSRAASLGQGMLMMLAARQKQAGKSIEEVAAYVEETRDHLCHWFTVDDLHHLKRGGRVSAAAALFGTMLHVKPILHVDDEGRLIPMEKVRGRKASIQALLNKMEELGTSFEDVYISHGDCREEVDEMADAIKARFGTKEVYINYVGPVIGNHTGAGVVALFFLGKHK